MPKTRSHAGGRAGLLAKPEPAIKVTAPKCKEEMECDRTTMVRTSEDEAMEKENQPPHPRRTRKRGRPNKSKPCFIPLNKGKGKGWEKGLTPGGQEGKGSFPHWIPMDAVPYAALKQGWTPPAPPTPAPAKPMAPPEQQQMPPIFGIIPMWGMGKGGIMGPLNTVDPAIIQSMTQAQVNAMQAQAAVPQPPPQRMTPHQPTERGCTRVTIHPENLFPDDPSPPHRRERKRNAPSRPITKTIWFEMGGKRFKGRYTEDSE